MNAHFIEAIEDEGIFQMGQNEEPRFWQVVPQVADELKPVGLGKLHIDDDEIRAQAQRKGPAFKGVLKFSKDDKTPVQAQHSRDQISE